MLQLSSSTVLGLIALVMVAMAAVKAPTDDCASAPTESAKIICHQLHKWDEQARNAAFKKKSALPPGVGARPAVLAPIASSIYQCMDLQCMCNYMRGTVAGNGQCRLPNGQYLKKAIRKEIRMMTDDERRRYFSAIRTLKEDGEYDRIARIHSQSTTVGGAHSGPAFLPWHREFTKRLEIAIRQIDPTLALPYWDSTLDGALARPNDSILFSPELGGTTNRQGYVETGPFTDWQTLEGRPNIKRAVGVKGSPMQESELDFVMRQSTVDQVLAFSAPRQGCPYRTDYNCLEYTHGNVHIFVGGDMYDTTTSANDPLFFNHHAFVDLIWENWRQQKQNRADRETVYPPDNQLCASPQHFAAAQMNPFAPLRNIDGLSNKYTDNLYEYAPRPKCTQSRTNCGSKFLFCDLSHGQARCSSKVRVGSTCTGYAYGENPCFNGACVSGRCTASSSTTTPLLNITASKVVVATQETCFNENECCAGWAEIGECKRNPSYMLSWCKASCGLCQPQYRLEDDCSDRHTNCQSWSRRGECTSNTLWMTENCRRSCKKCNRSRSQSCGNQNGDRGGGGGGGGGSNVPVKTTTEKPKPECGNTDDCFNENVCCPHWSLFGECRKSSEWMACNCRVSCGQCVPINYNYGSCLDYHPECAGWARLGECGRNQWMLENCRSSCRSCYSQWELRNICRRPVGSAVSAFTTTRRPPLAWQKGDWEDAGVNFDDWGNGGIMGWGDGGGGRGRWEPPPPPPPRLLPFIWFSERK